jgi:hypothetical protein
MPVTLSAPPWADGQAEHPSTDLICAVAAHAVRAYTGVEKAAEVVKEGAETVEEKARDARSQ